LGVPGPAFPFRGLLSSVSGLVFAVCRPPSSVLIINDTDTKHNAKCQRAVAHIPGANIKEFLGTSLSEPKRMQIPRLSKEGEFSERNTADQKFFSVSGMGFGQQPVNK
jgi:hypothetical protein